MRLSRGGDLNAHPIEYFPIEDDHRRVPKALTKLTYRHHWEPNRELPYAVDLPSKELR
jgi:hypothetical protein